MKSWKFIKRHDNELISIVARFLDILSFTLGGYLVFILRDWPEPVNGALYSVAGILGCLLAIIIFPFAGVYRTQRGQSWFTHFQRILFENV